MTRSILLTALAVTLTLPSAASAQVIIQPYPVPYPQPYPIWRPIIVPPQINPFVPYVPWNNGAIIQPWPRTAQFPVIGTLPNGIQVINPWGPRINPYYASNFVNYYGYNGGYYNPYGYNPYGYNQYGYGNNGFVNGVVYSPVRDPRGFLLGDVEAATSIMAGNTAPRTEIMTSDGLAPRLPATGSITAFGAIDPNTGQYFNPFNGTLQATTSSLSNTK